MPDCQREESYLGEYQHLAPTVTGTWFDRPVLRRKTSLPPILGLPCPSNLDLDDLVLAVDDKPHLFEFRRL